MKGAAIQRWPYRSSIRLYLPEGGSLLAAAALPLRVLVSLTSVHYEAKNKGHNVMVNHTLDKTYRRYYSSKYLSNGHTSVLNKLAVEGDLINLKGAAIQRWPYFIGQVRLYLPEGGSLLAAAALPLRVLVSLTLRLKINKKRTQCHGRSHTSQNI